MNSSFTAFQQLYDGSQLLLPNAWATRTCAAWRLKANAWPGC